MRSLRFSLVAATLALVPVTTSDAIAQMPSTNIGDVILVGFNYCPHGWVAANGTVYQASQNPSLAALLGATYGGDGTTTFAVPDLRGRIPIGAGQGFLMPIYTQGQKGGRQTMLLTEAEMPDHQHALLATNAGNDATSPSGNALTVLTGAGEAAYAAVGEFDQRVTFQEGTIRTAGSGFDFNLISPSLGLLYCVAWTGNYPSPN